MVKNLCQKSWKGINSQVWEYGHLGDFFNTQNETSDRNLQLLTLSKKSQV